jgi:hypothetical protein
MNISRILVGVFLVLPAVISAENTPASDETKRESQYNEFQKYLKRREPLGLVNRFDCMLTGRSGLAMFARPNLIPGTPKEELGLLLDESKRIEKEEKPKALDMLDRIERQMIRDYEPLITPASDVSQKELEAGKIGRVWLEVFAEILIGSNGRPIVLYRVKFSAIANLPIQNPLGKMTLFGVDVFEINESATSLIEIENLMPQMLNRFVQEHSKARAAWQ